MYDEARILILYTGGTIGMMKEYATGVLSAFNFDELLKHIPELSYLDCVIKTISFKVPVDSSNMSPAHWVEIAEIIQEHYNDTDGFVILHGSDTMSYTASALSFMLEHLEKPVIFTGSQLPIGDLRTDAKENLITAIQIASLRKNGIPIVQEVGLYFEYKLYRANRTTKINTEHFEAFASPNYPPLGESGVYLNINHSHLLTSDTKKKFTVQKNLNDNIALIKFFPGISKNMLNHILRYPGLEAVILETYGAGNVPEAPWLHELLKTILLNGTMIINITQCPGGRVVRRQYETSIHLKHPEVISGKDMTTEATLAKTMYLLGKNEPRSTFKSMFETSLRGEVS